MPIFLFNSKCPRRFLIPYEKDLRAIKNMRPNWESQRNCIAIKYEQEVAKEHPFARSSLLLRSGI